LVWSLKPITLLVNQKVCVFPTKFSGKIFFKNSYFQVPPKNQSLRVPPNEQRTEWMVLDEKQTLQEAGFTPKNARADEPIVLALVLPGYF